MRNRRKPISLGHPFGRLRFIGFAETNKHGQAVAECMCSCGNRAVVRTSMLRSGKTTSCGCVQRESMKRLRKRDPPRQLGHPLYWIWSSMRARCFYRTCKAYRDYGGRGITVCEGWRQFWNFVEDMSPRPDALTLDRINNDGNYSCGHCDECLSKEWPANCRWATNQQQTINKRPRKRNVPWRDILLGP